MGLVGMGHCLYRGLVGMGHCLYRKRSCYLHDHTGNIREVAERYDQGSSADQAEKRLVKNTYDDHYRLDLEIDHHVTYNDTAGTYTAGGVKRQVDYAYDDAHNRTDKNVTIGATTTQTDYTIKGGTANSNQVTKITTGGADTDLVYDSRGNRIIRNQKNTSGTTTHYTHYQYDHDNRLVSLAEWNSQPSLENGEPKTDTNGDYTTTPDNAYSYLHDYRTRRVTKTIFKKTLLFKKKGLHSFQCLAKNRVMKPRKMLLRSSVTGQEGQYFHVLSRVVERRFVFQVEEREFFRGLLRQVEAFSGVEVITWTMLSNHFHIVVHIPEKVEDLPEDVFWERLQALYSRDEIQEIRETMKLIPKMTPGLAGQHLLRDYRQKFIRRMHHLSEFMKTLMLRFTLWFNRRHQRVGRLWESRFKSVLIEGDWDPLMCVAAYVDLNAVRAGMVKDPKDYRWCGYAEAVVGKALARRGLGHLLFKEAQAAGELMDWRTVGREYRKILFGVGEERVDVITGREDRKGVKAAEVTKVMASGGKLTRSQLLRCRLRYFTDGLVIGSKTFIEGFFEEKREYFSERRKEGSRRMRGGDWGALRSGRDLQRRPIEKAGS